MAQPQTKAELFDLIEKTGVLDSWQFSQAIIDSESNSVTIADICESLINKGWATRFQVEQLLAGRSPWRMLGQYSILREIRNWGIGCIYEAECPLTHNRVMIRCLPKESWNEPSQYKGARQKELAATSRTHRNIIQVYEVVQEETFYYLITERIEGIGLNNVLRAQGPLLWPLACNYVCQIADALDYICKLGLVHERLIPRNIVIDSVGCIKLIDLGFDALLEDGDRYPIMVELPENRIEMIDYLATSGVNEDIRTNIYSLGCIFHYMLVGTVLYADLSPHDRQWCHWKSKSPKRFVELPDDVPDDVVAILTSMIAVRPEDRIQTPADVFWALQPFAEPRIEKMHEPPKETE